MKTKLTLSVDKDIVDFARQHAQSHHTSVSGMFSEFISDHKLHVDKKAVPNVESMVGSLKRYNIDDSKTAIRSNYAKKYSN
ncbi:MAG: DUF6364 family protein [Candidatus Saccharimonadales bacterium]